MPDTSDSTSAFKAKLLHEKTEEKQARLGGSSFLREKLQQELAPITTPGQEYKPYVRDPGTPERLGRGLYEGVAGSLNLGWGLAAGGAAIAESSLGEGGIATRVKEAAAKKYLDNQREMAEDAAPEDSLLYSWNKAKEGDFGAMVDWAAHGTGYVASQLASILMGSGAISSVTQLAGKKTITKVMGGLVRKEANRIATKELAEASIKTGVKATAEEITAHAASDTVLKAATSSIASKVGSQVGMGTMSFGLEGGEIMGDLAQQSIDRGKPLTGEEIGKGLSATALAGAVEYLETVMNVKALKGKLGKLPGAETVNGLKGKALRSGITGGKVAAGEAGQEYVQTGIEQWGKGQDLNTEEARNERIDAAGLGALGGGPASVGGLFTRSTKEQEVAAKKKAEKLATKRLVTPETQPDYAEKKVEVAEAVESGNISQYTDPTKKDTYAPKVVMDVLHDKAKDKDATVEEKIKTVEDAKALFESLAKEKDELYEKSQSIVKLAEKENRERTVEETKTVKEADARSAVLDTLMEKTHPLLVSMLQNKQAPVETHAETLKQFKKVITEGSSADVQKVIRKVYGSSGGAAFLQDSTEGEESLDLEQLLTENRDRLDEETIEQIEQTLSLRKAIEKVSAQKVNTDIIKGGRSNDYMSIPDHLQGVASAIESGDMDLAKNRQKNLERWAKTREHRAQTFMGMAQAFNKKTAPDPGIKKAFDAINTKQRSNGLKEYSIGPATLGLAKTMFLEAEALKQAVKAGQKNFPGLPREKPAAKPAPVVETPKEQPKPIEPVQEKVVEPVVKEEPAPVEVPKETPVVEEVKPEPVNEEPAPVQEVKPIEKEAPVVEEPAPLKSEPKAEEVVQMADLKSVGFRDSEIEQIASDPKVAQDVLKYAKLSIDKLRDAYTKAEEDPKLQKLIEKIAAVKQRVMRVALTTSQLKAKDVQLTKAAYKEINPVQVFGFPKAGPPNLFNKGVDIIQHLKDLLKSYTWETKEDTAKKEHDALKSFISYAETFSKGLDEIFKTNKIGHEYRNSLNYLTTDGQIHENVKLIMALNGFDWLTTEAGKSTDDKTVRKILGLPPSTVVPDYALRLLSGKGNKAVYLADSMGRRMFKDLQIGFTGEATQNLEESLGTAMGMATLATFQHERLVDRHYINSGIREDKKKNEATDGLHGLARKLKGQITTEITDFLRGHPKDKKEIELNKAGRDVSDTFYSRAKNIRVEGLVKAAKPLKAVLTDTFSLDREGEEVTFVEPKPAGELRPLTKSDEFAVKFQTEHIEQNERVPYVRSEDTMDVLEAFPIEVQKTFAGSQTLDGKHKSRHVRIESVNNGIDRAFDAIETWKLLAEKAGGISAEFFIRAVFQANSRMRQIGLIQPQNNKIMRSLFTMKNAIVKVNPKNEDHRRAFMEAVALGLGKEASKENTLDDAIQKAQDMLNTDTMRAGLKVIDQILSGNKELTPEQHQAVAAAVKEGGEDLHTFKCLVAYQKYQRAEGNEFTTDVYIERDGLSNGPFMMLLQLSRGVSESLLRRLMSTGLGFISKEKSTEADHRLSKDPYEAIGVHWDRILLKTKVLLEKSPQDFSLFPDEAKLEIQRIDAISSILGSIEDQEALTNHTRKMAKSMTVGAIYGAGRTSTVRSLITHILDSVIPKTLEKVAALRAEGKVEEAANMSQYLQANLRTLSGLPENVPIWKGKGLEAELTKEARQNIEKSINGEYDKDRKARVGGKYGDALFDAMENVYGDFRDSSKVLNRGIGLLAARYNAALRVLIDQIKGRPVTKNDIKEIKKKLRPLLPKIKTPMGGTMALFDFTGEDLLPDDDFAQIQQYYKPAEITVLNSKARAMRELKASGVKPVPTMIHMLDSMVANGLMGEMDSETRALLNVHDAGITGIFDSKFMSDAQNRLMHKFMSKYHIADEVQEAVESTMAAFNTLIEEGVFDQEFITEKGKKTVKANPKALMSAIYAQYKRNDYHKDGKKTLNIKEIKDKALAEIKQTAIETKATKEAILSKAPFINQYYDPDGGWATGVEPSEDIGGVSVAELLRPDVTLMTAEELYDSADVEVLEDTAEMEERIHLGSSRRSDLSTDPADYKLAGIIENHNLVTTYDGIKNQGPKKVSADHDAHLRRILSNLVQAVMQPLDLFIKFSPNRQTEGAFVHEQGARDQVFISNFSGMLNQGIQMSTGEVYAHELVHSVIHHGLDVNDALYAKVSRLYHVAHKELSKMYPGEEFRVFLNDPMDLADVDEVAQAKERYDYLFQDAGTHGEDQRNEYTGVTSKKTRSNHIDEFMTFGLTNENFGKFLKSLPLNQTGYTKSTWSSIKGANIQDTLFNIFQAILNFFRGKLSGINNRTAYQEVEALAYDLARINTAQKTKRFERARKFVGYAGQFSRYGNQFIKSSVKKIPRVAKWKEGLDRAIARPDMLGQTLRDIINKWDAMDQNLFKTTVQEFHGATDRLEPFYQLLSRRRLVLDSAKEAAAHAYKNMANDFFKEELTDTQKITFTKAGLKPDASALLDTFSQAKLLEMYKDPKALQAEIDRLLNTLSKNKNLQPHVPYYKSAAFALGNFMTTGKSSKDDHVFLNTQAIADLLGLKDYGTLQEQDVIEAEAILEQVISLYAIRSLPMAQRANFALLMEEDPDGVMAVLRMHQNLKDTAKSSAFRGDRYLFRKGYTKSILNTEVDLEYGLLEDEEAYAKAGYTRSRKPIPRDNADPNAHIDVYIYTAKTGRMNDFQSMILSLSRNKAAGANSRKMDMQMDQGTAAGLRNLRKLKADKKSILAEMADPNRKRDAALGTSLVAQLDQYGNITDYRYMMSESVKDNYLDQVNQFDAIIGAMAGQLIDKKKTPEINRELISLIKETYDDGYSKNPAAFIEVGPNASDPRMVEQYYLIPESTRKYIKQIWGASKTMYVPKDVMTLAFGYRKYSITEAFTKKPAERVWLEKMVVSLFNHVLGEGKGIKVANNAEKLSVELAQLAKDNIIVKSLSVTLNNFGSNMVYLKGKGVPMTMIFKLGYEAIKFGTKYQADSFKLNKLGVEESVLRKNNSVKAQQRLQEIKKEMMVLKDSLARNPVIDSIDSGLMPSLIDEVDTQGQQNLFPGMIEKTVDKATKKLPSALQITGKVAFLTQDTSGYKVLNNAVKMTDFVGRHVLYNYYTKNLKMSQKEAAEKAIAEFINFDIPSHRITEYFNQIGLLRFTKYATRIPMVAFNAIKDRPFDALTSYLFSVELGLDNIFDSVGNLNQKVGTPVDFAWGAADEAASVQIMESILR